MSNAPIIVVSGLPRSGTSLMMQMLAAGGVEVVSDGIRAADADNPHGYQEVEAVKKLSEDSAWLSTVPGKAIKVVSMLLYELPPQFEYRVIFMQRPYVEVLASQREMLRRRGAPAGGPDDGTMQRHFENHLEKVRVWLQARSNFSVLHCPYHELLSGSLPALNRLADFLGRPLDISAMVQAVDPQLYRNRASTPASAGPVA